MTRAILPLDRNYPTHKYKLDSILVEVDVGQPFEGGGVGDGHQAHMHSYSGNDGALSAMLARLEKSNPAYKIGEKQLEKRGAREKRGSERCAFE